MVADHASHPRAAWWKRSTKGRAALCPLLRLPHSQAPHSLPLSAGGFGAVWDGGASPTPRFSRRLTGTSAPSRALRTARRGPPQHGPARDGGSPASPRPRPRPLGAPRAAHGEAEPRLGQAEERRRHGWAPARGAPR